MSAIPIPDPEVEREKNRIKIEGEIPSPINPKPGCRFAARCIYATDECKKPQSIEEVSEGHFVSCCHVGSVNGE